MLKKLVCWFLIVSILPTSGLATPFEKKAESTQLLRALYGKLNERFETLGAPTFDIDSHLEKALAEGTLEKSEVHQILLALYLSAGLPETALGPFSRSLMDEQKSFPRFMKAWRASHLPQTDQLTQSSDIEETLKSLEHSYAQCQQEQEVCSWRLGGFLKKTLIVTAIVALKEFSFRCCFPHLRNAEWDGLSITVIMLFLISTGPGAVKDFCDYMSAQKKLFQISSELNSLPATSMEEWEAVKQRHMIESVIQEGSDLIARLGIPRLSQIFQLIDARVLAMPCYADLEGDCPICWETLFHSEVRVLPCDHGYHERCISLLNRCPVCTPDF